MDELGGRLIFAEPMQHTSFEGSGEEGMATEGEELLAAEGLPDWQLIDEISIRLLEQGIGTFETLQRALPSVALVQIRQIVPDPADGHPSSSPPPAGACGVSRMLKLFRLAQLQIDYLLNTQQTLVDRLGKMECKYDRMRRENRAMREQFCHGTPEERAAAEAGKGELAAEKDGGKKKTAAEWRRELFRCVECSKLFLHANFLADHLIRRHNGQLQQTDSVADSRAKGGTTIVPPAMEGNKAGRVLGLAAEQDQRQQRTTTKSSLKQQKGQQRIQRGQSQMGGSSGTFRKRTDARSATGVFQARNWHQLELMSSTSGGRSQSSIGAEEDHPITQRSSEDTFAGAGGKAAYYS